LIDWLGRSANDFGFELSAGVLCVAREGYLSGDDLAGLVSDASHVAAAVADECQEATDAGSAAAQGAHSKPLDPKVEGTLTDVVGDTVPDHLGATTGEFRGHLFASPAVYARALLWSILIALGINVFLL